jgi:hypothetical protein
VPPHETRRKQLAKSTAECVHLQLSNSAPSLKLWIDQRANPLQLAAPFIDCRLNRALLKESSTQNPESGISTDRQVNQRVILTSGYCIMDIPWLAAVQLIRW